jgi:hypothetical protein
MRSMLVGLAIVVMAIAGCATGASSPVATVSPPSTVSTTPETASPSTSKPAIVGEWVGIHDCERIVAMLGEAGLDEFLADAVYGNELIPGVDPGTTTLKDPTGPCNGAVERQHSHFFTASARWGRGTSAASRSTTARTRWRATTGS